jgi:hypothetical protein
LDDSNRPSTAGPARARARVEPIDPGPREPATGAAELTDVPPSKVAPKLPAPAPPTSVGPATIAARPPAPPDDPGAPAGSDLATLRNRWPEVVARISAHPPTKPLIVVCRPIAVEDGVVTLGFPEDQGFLRDVAERRRTVLEDGIAAVLGRSVGVRCVATNLDLVPDIPADAEAAFVLAEARRIFGSDEPDAAEVT